MTNPTQPSRLYADGHNINLNVDGGNVVASINGVTSNMTIHDAEALLALLETAVNGYTD